MNTRSDEPKLANLLSQGASHRFEFRVQGHGINPLTVPLFKLLEVLKRTNAAIRATGGPGVEEGLNLVRIGDGSVTCELAANDEAFAATDRLTKVVASGDLSDLPITARDKVHQLWEYTVENGWESVAFCSVGGEHIFAEIRFDEEPPVWNTYKGATTIYGRCNRVGGESRRTAQIQLLNGQTVYATLATKDLAQQLGERLYQIVGLEGEATWDNETQKLIDFRAEVLSPYRERNDKGKTRTISEAFHNLADAAGDRWDNTDPTDFIKDLRDD